MECVYVSLLDSTCEDVMENMQIYWEICSILLLMCKVAIGFEKLCSTVVI
jgi:hypothetical protein